MHAPLSFCSPYGLEGQADFNDALKTFLDTVGPFYTVGMTLKLAAAPDVPTVMASLLKPEFKGHRDKETYMPASLLDIYATKSGKEIFAAQLGLAEQVHKLAAASKDLSVAYTHEKCLLQEPTETDIEDKEKLLAVLTTVGHFNIQAYKLTHVALNCNGDVSIAGGLVAVIKSLKKFAEEKLKEAGKDAKVGGFGCWVVMGAGLFRSLSFLFDCAVLGICAVAYSLSSGLA